MFKKQKGKSLKAYRFAITCLLALSVAALLITIWIMYDFVREQEIVQGLIEQLPATSVKPALTLADELRWQFRLAILVVINLIVTGFALYLVSNAYLSSQLSLEKITALANDIIASVDQTIITTDLEGVITSHNTHATDLLEVPEELEGSHLTQIPSKIPIAEFWRRSQTHSEPDYVEQLSPDLTTVIQGNCQPLRNHEGDIVGSVIQLRDVTKQHLTEERLRRMERFMGLGSMAAGLHHEIKNPLAALSLHVQLLDEYLEHPRSPETQEMLDVIGYEVRRVGQVLNRFSDFASIDNLQRAEVSPAELIAKQIELVRPRAESHHINIQTQSRISVDLTLSLDRVRMEQVILNLLINSMEAMPEGGDLSVILEQTNDELLIHFRDSGPGIPDELAHQVFDPYFTTKTNGSGMGLALCDKYLRQHGGAIDFASNSSGTTFTVALPLQENTPEPSAS